MLAALEDRKPSRFSWAIGDVDFAANRRTPGGPVDHSLPRCSSMTLMARCAPSYNYAAIADARRQLVSGDGATRRFTSMAPREDARIRPAAPDSNPTAPFTRVG
jgi:hypothetical protein